MLRCGALSKTNRCISWETQTLTHARRMCPFPGLACGDTLRSSEQTPSQHAHALALTPLHPSATLCGVRCGGERVRTWMENNAVEGAGACSVQLSPPSVVLASLPSLPASHPQAPPVPAPKLQLHHTVLLSAVVCCGAHVLPPSSVYSTVLASPTAQPCSLRNTSVTPTPTVRQWHPLLEDKQGCCRGGAQCAHLIRSMCFRLVATPVG
jgi:hypothetical protein